MTAPAFQSQTPMEALHSWVTSFPPPRVAGKPVELRSGQYWLRVEFEPEHALRQTDVDQFDTCKALIHTLLIMGGLSQVELFDFRAMVYGDNTLVFEYAELGDTVVAISWVEGL